MMDAIFSDMIDDNLVIIYMDDILIFVPDELILAENTKKVLPGLQENDLFLNRQNASSIRQRLTT